MGPAPGPGYRVPLDQTAQERHHDLLTQAASLALQPTFTAVDLLNAAQQLSAAGSRGPLVGPPLAVAGGVQAEPGNSSNANSLAALLARTNLNTSATDTDSRGENLSSDDLLYSRCFTFIEKHGGHETGDFSFATDFLGLGTTKAQQQFNSILHGTQRADASDLFSNTPGKMGIVYDQDEGNTLGAFSQTERRYPEAGYLERWGLDRGEFFVQLPLSYHKGVFHPSHPHYSHTIRMIHLYAGTNAFIHALILSLTQSGLPFKVSYMAAVFFYQSVLQGLDRSRGSELTLRMITIGQATRANQRYLAAHAVLYLNTGLYVQKAQDFVGASPPVSKKPEKEKKKLDREAPRERPGACPLCKKTDCAGYQAPSYLCENPIKTPCRLCSFLHARSGRRKSPCGAPEPPQAPP
jgi:hypothetical protein